MIEDQEYILLKIRKIIEEQHPDAVLVAGDIFDRTVASEEAIKLWDGFLVSLAGDHIPLFAIPGNHDSAVRVSDHSDLIDTVGIHLSGPYDGSVRKVTLNDDDGAVNIYMLPFIKPVMVRSIFPDEEINDYTDACRAAIAHMEVDTSERNVLIAHQYVAGAARCDSEDIPVGGLDSVDSSVFDDFDYVALGHLHGPQSAGRKEVRYCGTPLKYSFSEKDHVKSVTVVDLGPKGTVDISEIPLVPRHDMREIRGTYDELVSRENYEGTAVDDYILAVLTDENDVYDAMPRLRAVYPNLMKIRYENKRTSEMRELSDDVDVKSKSPLELFEEFYETQNNDKMNEEQREFAQKLIEAVWGN